MVWYAGSTTILNDRMERVVNEKQYDERFTGAFTAGFLTGTTFSAILFITMLLAAGLY